MENPIVPILSAYAYFILTDSDVLGWGLRWLRPLPLAVLRYEKINKYKLFSHHNNHFAAHNHVSCKITSWTDIVNVRGYNSTTPIKCMYKCIASTPHITTNLEKSWVRHWILEESKQKPRGTRKNRTIHSIARPSYSSRSTRLKARSRVVNTFGPLLDGTF